MASVAGLKLPDQDGQEGNFKNALNALVQRMSGTSMSKTDIVYETVRHGEQYQCTATLVCLEGQQAAGELSMTSKDAEQSAAYQGIMGLEQELGNLGYSLSERTLEIPPSVRQAAIQAAVFTPGHGPNIQEAMTDAAIKNMLHAVLAQVKGTKLEPGDLEYTWTKAEVAGLHTATLKVPKLAGELAITEWYGMASPFKRDTQLDCGLKAMDTILTNPKYAMTIDLTGKVEIKSSADKKQKEREVRREKRKEAQMLDPTGILGINTKGKGKGKGKGKDGKDGDKGKSSSKSFGKMSSFDSAPKGNGKKGGKMGGMMGDMGMMDMMDGGYGDDWGGCGDMMMMGMMQQQMMMSQMMNQMFMKGAAYGAGKGDKGKGKGGKGKGSPY